MPVPYEVNADFTLFRDLSGIDDEGRKQMLIGRDLRAITRGAKARPGAALILGTLLLLIRP